MEINGASKLTNLDRSLNIENLSVAGENLPGRVDLEEVGLVVLGALQQAVEDVSPRVVTLELIYSTHTLNSTNLQTQKQTLLRHS